VGTTCRKFGLKSGTQSTHQRSQCSRRLTPSPERVANQMSNMRMGVAPFGASLPPSNAGMLQPEIMMDANMRPIQTPLYQMPSRLNQARPPSSNHPKTHTSPPQFGRGPATSQGQVAYVNCQSTAGAYAFMRHLGGNAATGACIPHFVSFLTILEYFTTATTNA
jgi:hypothetical protein